MDCIKIFSRWGESINADKAKNLAILFFVILNIVLLSLMLIGRVKYRVSDKQQRYIHALLEKNNITLDAKIMTEFRPIRQLSLNQKYMDVELVTNWLFDNGENFTVSDEFDRQIFRSDRKTLTYDKQQFVMEIPDGTGKIELNPQNARRVCEEKLNELNISQIEFEEDNEFFIGDESIILEYRAKYSGNVIYSSYVIFRVTESSIVEIKAGLLSCNGYTDAAKEIYAPDEALQALLYELKNLYGDIEKNIVINRLDIVYYLDFSKSGESSELKAIPYYRFYIDERSEPFLINAYFNTVLR